jgi:hypothetical protein
MQKLEYTTQEDFLSKEIIRLTASRKELRENYIEEHRLFKNGDAVVIKYVNGTVDKAFIKSANEIDGNVYYYFTAMKKDGTPSAHSYYASGQFGKSFQLDLLHTNYRSKDTDGKPLY